MLHKVKRRKLQNRRYSMKKIKQIESETEEIERNHANIK